jgi:hypothetical protein
MPDQRCGGSFESRLQLPDVDGQNCAQANGQTNHLDASLLIELTENANRTRHNSFPRNRKARLSEAGFSNPRYTSMPDRLLLILPKAAE